MFGKKQKKKSPVDKEFEFSMYLIKNQKTGNQEDPVLRSYNYYFTSNAGTTHEHD